MKICLNKIYVVQKFDTIDTIAKKYNVNPFSILIKNNLTPKMIKEGIVLFIENKN